MSNGMRIDGRELPLAMQEQAAMEFLSRHGGGVSQEVQKGNQISFEERKNGKSNLQTERQKMKKFSEYGLSHKSDELKKLIAENPDLPIVVLASDEANNGDWAWQYCFSVSFGLEEILECDYADNDDTVFTDRDRLEEKISDDLYDEYHNKSFVEYDEAVKHKMAELEPYWTKVIAIYASN